MRLLRRLVATSIGTFVLVAVLQFPGDAARAGDAPFQNIQLWGGDYAGTTSQGHRATVFISANAHLAQLVVEVELQEPCAGTIVTVDLEDMDIGVDDGDFSGSSPTGGGGGQLLQAEVSGRVGGAGEEIPVPYVFGSVTGHTKDFGCAGGAQFYAVPDGLLFGDVDCSFLDRFADTRSRVSSSGGGGDPFSITAVDALRTLRFVAGLDRAGGPVAGEGDPPICPPIGEELPNGRIHGDSDCDGDVDSVDALRQLRWVAGFDQPDPPPPSLEPPAPPAPPGFCPGIGGFWWPFFPALPRQ